MIFIFFVVKSFLFVGNSFSIVCDSFMFVVNQLSHNLTKINKNYELKIFIK